MSVGYFILGLIFLFNPNVNLIDVLPDFIGYAFILKGMSKCQYANLSFTEAYEKFRTLMLVGIIKIPALLIYTTINVDGLLVFSETGVAGQAGKYTDYTAILIVTLIFAIIEAYLALSAFTDFFDGLMISSYKLEASAVSEGYSGIRRFTLAFAIIKPVMYVLPELSSLSTGSSGYVTDSGILNLSQYRSVFIVLSVIVSLLIGSIWLFKSVKYFKRIKNDEAYLYMLEQDGKVSVSETAKNARIVKFSLMMLVGAVILNFDIRLDGISLIPGFFSSLLFLVFFEAVKRGFEDSRKVLTRVISISGAALSFAAWLSTFLLSTRFYKYNEKFGYSEIMYGEIEDSFEARDAFFVTLIICVISSVITALVITLVFKKLKELVSVYMKIPERGGDILLFDVRDAEHRLKKISVLLILAYSLGVLASLSGAFMTFAAVFFPMWWAADMLIRVAFIAVSLLAISILKGEVAKMEKEK